MTPPSFDDSERLLRLLKEAAAAAGTTVIHTHGHRYSPQGVSVVVVIQESHLSIHTWPEQAYAAVDFYTCGNGSPRAARDVLMQGLVDRYPKRTIIVLTQTVLTLQAVALAWLAWRGTVQLTPSDLRGRTMSVYALVFQGMLRAGGMQAGFMDTLVGAPLTIAEGRSCR